MNSVCDGCGERINKLNQQVSIMRKEMKNLRQMLDSGIRSHRKHMTSIQSAVSTIGSSGSSDPGGGRSVPPPSPQLVLEQGNIQTVPIGYIRSCFSVKTGTPRQPTICGPSRAELRIQQSVFNNPDHALVGLEQYSHVWIIFLFHKNGHLSYKAKVKPPRLNGERVGVYSTRSPHRPNALGLTLAKLERIEGDTIHLSDIDMISGTPVLDIKPYIPEYDCPQARLSTDSDARQSTDRTQPDEAVSLHEEAANTSNASKDSDTDVHLKFKGDRTDCHANSGSGSLLSSQASAAHLSSTGDGSCSSSSGVSTQFSLSEDFNNVLEDVKAFVTQKDLCQLTSEDKERLVDTPKSLESVVERPCYGEDAHSTIAGWIREPPVASLQDRHKVTGPGSSFCRVQRKLLPPSEGCCLQTPAPSTGGHAAQTDSSTSPWTRLTSRVGLDKALPRCCRSDLSSGALPCLAALTHACNESTGRRPTFHVS
ncbi:tRNA (adenine(37)-N6)-methyltransferase isoform X2 [Genypterus blacodes]|uniref:tRNA (adenine(37)-N6)-methyltransferase isoform X2 n=1 Tax=Genypterus blacodes TaxID=154954 RepID=UPI003F76C66A